jgi:nicotinate-nucleotide--dimethylbenzimidazole phosphoribosyltransferase
LASVAIANPYRGFNLQASQSRKHPATYLEGLPQVQDKILSIKSQQTADLTGHPLDDTRDLLRRLPSFDDAAVAHAQHRQTMAYHDPRERGHLSALAAWLSGRRAVATSPVAKIGLCIFAGAHGWLAQDRQEAAIKSLKTRLLILSAGGSPANVQAGRMGAAVQVFDLAIDQPSANASIADGMTELECARAVAFGMQAIQQQYDVLVLHSLGAGGREVSAAMAICLFGGDSADWVAGAMTDLSEEFNRACTVIGIMAERAQRGTPDPLELLRRLGSREMAALAGAILAARLQQVPVILDGFDAVIAAAVLAKAAPGAMEHCLVADRDGTAAFDRLLSTLSVEPVQHHKIRGGDGLAGLLAACDLQTSAALQLEIVSQDQVQKLLSNGNVTPV